MRKTSFITVLDQFCGAGGSSLGASAAGAEIRFAINHWDLAVETHNTNFPHADHDCADVSACDPRRYPRTDVLITSPECTNHTVAKGVKRKQAQQALFSGDAPDPSAERSRATMWDVCRFAEAHRHEIVIVENVVDAREWECWDAWLHAMRSLGYEHRAVFFNSMFAHPTPQSRDRMYVVFWRRGNRAPDLEFRPRAFCLACSREVEAVQAWKRPTRQFGKYGADPRRNQYVYRCPMCAGIVQPYFYCALNAIDFSLPAERIGDRAKALRPKTLARIKTGLERFAGEQLFLLPMTHETARLSSALYAMPTQTATSHWGIAGQPFTVDTTFGDDSGRVRAAIDAMGAQTTRQAVGVAFPPFNVELRTNSTPSLLDDSLATVCAGAQHIGIVLPAGGPDVGDRALDEALATQTGSERFAIAGGAMLMTMRDSRGVGYLTRSLGRELATQMATATQDFVVSRTPFLVNYNETGRAHAIDEGLPTQDTRDRFGLVQPGAEIDVDECFFRMLQPHEIQHAMAFPAGYSVLGNKRDRVKQLGNAVTPPVMQMLFERCVDTLR